MAHLEKYNFGNETISFQNYINFHEFFRENYSKIEGKLKNKGVITKNKLKKMIEEFKKEKNAAITNGQIDLFIYALDLNCNFKKQLFIYFSSIFVLMLILVILII